MNYDFYDPKLIAKEGIKLKGYPQIIDGQSEVDATKLAVVALISKEGQVCAVDVSNPVIHHAFKEGSCRVPHGVCQGKMEYYVVSKELLAHYGASESRIAVPEGEIHEKLGRSAA